VQQLADYDGIVFEKTDRWRAHRPNRPEEASFAVRNESDRTVYWEFAEERVHGVRLPKPVSLAKPWRSGCTAFKMGRLFRLLPGEKMEVLLSFVVEVDSDCLWNGGEDWMSPPPASSEPEECPTASYSTGLFVCRAQRTRSAAAAEPAAGCSSRGRAKRIATRGFLPIAFEDRLSWTIAVPHNHSAQHCARLYVEMETGDQRVGKHWTKGEPFSTKDREINPPYYSDHESDSENERVWQASQKRVCEEALRE
jgi:hypothetical protein